MPNYRADPDIGELLSSGFAIPEGLDPAEAEALQDFLRADRALETFYRNNAATARPPEADLREAASTAMAAYDYLAPKLPVGWRKFLVLQAGIAGGPDNLDDFRVKEWAYDRIHADNPDWLGDFDDDVDHDRPMRWLSQTIGLDVLMARQRAESATPTKAAAGGGCVLVALSLLTIVAVTALLG